VSGRSDSMVNVLVWIAGGRRVRSGVLRVPLVGCLDERTFGVCDLTLPARASEPWTLPMIAGYLLLMSTVGWGCLWWRAVISPPSLVRWRYGVQIVGVGNDWGW